MRISTILAVGAVLTGIAGLTQPAEAKTNVYIGIGVPYGFPYAPGYGAQCFGHGYRYCWPGGYYIDRYPHYYVPRQYHRPRAVYGYRRYDQRLSCAQVRFKLRERGWRVTDSIDCKGGVYRFRGWHGNHRYVVDVNAASGKVIARSRYR